MLIDMNDILANVLQLTNFKIIRIQNTRFYNWYIVSKQWHNFCLSSFKLSQLTLEPGPLKALPRHWAGVLDVVRKLC